MGRNEEAARYSGVDVRRTVASAYVFLERWLVLQVSFLLSTQTPISPSSHGNFFELYGIAAAVLGGCSLRGGEGSILGIVTGTALLQILQNLVNLLGVPSSLNFAVMGAVILAGVVADQVLTRRATRVEVKLLSVTMVADSDGHQAINRHAAGAHSAPAAWAALMIQRFWIPAFAGMTR